MEAKLLTVGEGNHKYGKEEEETELCDTGIRGINMNFSFLIHTQIDRRCVYTQMHAHMYIHKYIS